MYSRNKHANSRGDDGGGSQRSFCDSYAGPFVTRTRRPSATRTRGGSPEKVMCTGQAGTHSCSDISEVRSACLEPFPGHFTCCRHTDGDFLSGRRYSVFCLPVLMTAILPRENFSTCNNLLGPHTTGSFRIEVCVYLYKSEPSTTGESAHRLAALQSIHYP